MRKLQLKLPVKLNDRYNVLENSRKQGELNEFRRRKMAMREALNHHLELERLRGLTANQRMASLHHDEARKQKLDGMIQRVLAGFY